MTQKQQSKPKTSYVLRVLRAIMIEPMIRAGDAHHLYAKVTSWPDYRPEMREEYWHENAPDADKLSDVELAEAKMKQMRRTARARDIDDYLPAMRLARLIYSNVHYLDHWRALIWHAGGASYARIGRRLGCSHTAARNKILKCYELIELAALRDEASEEMSEAERIKKAFAADRKQVAA